MANFLQKVKTVTLNPAMLILYIKWFLNKRLGLDPKLKILNFGHIGHIRHFSEFIFVKDNIDEMKYGGKIALIRHVLSKADKGAVFDIGANVGVYSIAMAGIDKGNVVYAFEPTPSTLLILRKNLVDNRLKDVIIEPLAVSNICGSIKFLDGLDSPCQNKIQISQNKHFEDSTGLIEVETVTLDRYCSDRGIGYIKFLKIDIEGAELHALYGAKDLLSTKRIGALLIEVIPLAIENMGLKIESLFDYMHSKGYNFFAVECDGMIGKELLLSDIKKIEQEDVIILSPTLKAKFMKP